MEIGNITIRQTGTDFSDRSRHASTMRHVARWDRYKNHKQKPEVTMITTATEMIIIVYGALHIIIIYFVHCRVPYRRHTRNCVETRRQYQNIVRVVGAGVGGGSSSYYFESHDL